MPPELEHYFAKHVDSLLKDYSSRAGEGLIKIERIDPAPDSEGEEAGAKINNLQEVTLVNQMNHLPRADCYLLRSEIYNSFFTRNQRANVGI